MNKKSPKTGFIFSFQVDLIHINSVPGNDTVSYGMDLSEYYLNVEWDILSVPAERHVKKYPCCPEPYPDIYFNMIIRRKPLFYIVNLIIPCVGIFYLSILVFYMPAQSKQKTSLVCTVVTSTCLFTFLKLPKCKQNNFVYFFRLLLFWCLKRFT